MMYKIIDSSLNVYGETCEILKTERMTYDGYNEIWILKEYSYDYLHYFVKTKHWKGWLKHSQLTFIT